MLDTKKVARRTVQYQSLQEALGDAERLATADAPTTGNWSKGQIYEHLATILDMGVNGSEKKASFFMRLVAKYVIRPMIFRKGMTPGFQLPKWASKAIAPDDTEIDKALQHLRQSTEQFQAAEELHPHPFFGVMDKNSWNTLALHHAELHMSFIAEA